MEIIVHILWMYNSNHPCTWYEILPYVQHSYNRTLHSSTSHSPFQVGLGFQPLGSIDVALPLAVTSTDSSPAPTKANKSIWFIERIQHICQQVQDILQKSNDKYKQRHDQHRVPHKFYVGKKIWFHLQKECLTGPHRIKGSQQQRMQLYGVIKAGHLLHQGKWLTQGQVQQKFPHLMGDLNEMEAIDS
jgi:hypothetical protein